MVKAINRSEAQIAAIRKNADRRLTALSNERTSWYEHWQEISKYILPRRGRFLGSGGGANKSNRGSKLNGAILDEKALLSLRVFSAGMTAGCTSPSRPWFKIGVAGYDMKKFGPVKVWAEGVRDEIFACMARSNFYNSVGTIYDELGAFGTGVVIIEEDDDDDIRCTVLTVGEYYLANNGRNVVDTLYRVFAMTVDQMVRRFGKENCSDEVQNAYTTGQVDGERDVVHAIEPNDGRVLDCQLSEDKPYRSIYYEKDRADNKLLRYSGYDAFPAMCPRWYQSGNEAYGRSCGMDVLPAARSAQHLARRFAELVDKSSRPPVTAPASLKNEPMSMLPGGVTFVPDQTAAKFGASMQVMPGSLSAVREAIKEVQQVISRGFYEDLFLMLSQMDGVQPRQNLEVIERREEKMLMLGNALERLHDELLDPALQRIFWILARRGKLPPPPPELQQGGANILVEYISVLAQAQKSVGLTGIERLLGFAGNIAASKPEVLDKIDIDGTLEAYADMLGVPPSLILDQKAVLAIRAQRQKQAQAQQAMTLAQPAVNAAKVLSDTETGAGQNALAKMMGV